MKKSYEIDMTSGPLLGKILLFSIPLMLSGILQLLFNAADIIVVGRGRSVKGPYEKMNEAYLDCLRRLSLLRGSGGGGLHIFAHQPIN